MEGWNFCNFSNLELKLSFIKSVVRKPLSLGFNKITSPLANVQGDQLNMVCYLRKCNLVSVHVGNSVHCTSDFFFTRYQKNTAMFNWSAFRRPLWLYKR